MTKQQIEKLILIFEKLDGYKKQIIEVKALLFEVRNKTEFGNQIKEFNIMLPSGKTLNTNSSRLICDELARHGLLERDKFNVLPELRHIFAIKALSKDNPRRIQNLKISKTIYPISYVKFSEDGEYEPTLYNQGVIYTAIHENNIDIFHEKKDPTDNLLYQLGLMRHIKIMCFKTPITLSWLESRSDIIKAYICCSKLLTAFSVESKPTDYKAIYSFYKTEEFSSLKNPYLLYLMVQIDVCSGDFKGANKKMSLIKDQSSPYYLSSLATQLFFKTDYESASAIYKKALLGFKKLHRKRQWFMHDIHGVFYILIMLYKENKVTDAIKYIDIVKKQSLSLGFSNRIIYQLIDCLAQLQKGDKDTAVELFDYISQKNACHFYKSFYELIKYALDPEKLNKSIESINGLQGDALKDTSLLAVHIYEELQQKGDQKRTTDHLLSTPLRFLDIIEVKEAWEYQLSDLESVFLGKENLINTAEIDQSKRLTWLLNPDKLSVNVIEQSLGKTGWSKGRSVSLKRLYSDQKDFTYLTHQDKQALNGLRKKSDGWYSSNYVYTFSPKGTITNLIAHPNVYHADNPSLRLDLVEVDPEIYIEEKDNQYQINLSHTTSSKGFTLEQESINRYRVIIFNTEYQNLNKIIPHNGLTLPAKAKSRVLEIIQNAKRELKVHSGIADVDIPEVEVNITPLVQLLPIGDDVQLTIWIKPFGDQGPYCKAGHGKKDIITSIFENDIEIRKKAKRSFAKEKHSVNQLLSNCPSIDSYHVDNNIYLIDQLEDVLEVLSGLEVLKADNKINIEWPQGEKYKIRKTASSSSMSLKIKSEHNWFEFEGGIDISDDQVLEMQVLLEGLADNPTRFIALNNGEFLELTTSFRKQLGILGAIADGNKIYNLGASALVTIAEQVDALTVDTGWEDHLKQIKKMGKHLPKIPSTLQANLRDYQEEGYRYLSTLAHWGIGACLADDMGLGKTIQSIALVLEHANKGATLIVAPTSVCFNWVEEIKKFAPTLNVYSMYDIDRKNGLSEIKKMDVLICSYGLLHHNEEMLSKKTWETIIIDEAQAIKNPNTKRWKAAMKLKGKVRVALTGTPIENHLGELWSISNFINPGMLGSQKYFQKNYATPIEGDQNADKMQALKSLMNPYILRRLKSEVLSELPPKTEQTIYIEPTDEETAFYEALRQNAMEKLASSDKSNNRITILAEISKLRQACCDSSLANSDVSISNSKLKYFRETLSNIIENGHKVLVFSQYVRFLNIIQEALKEDKIHYQYIDGSTPQAQRKKNVEAFQDGDGDVFLLSLKAGGSGLNLTAADYVIHLDPWWNPAVEDQASDRAHRIGQERPVTIYRLIMKNTIEEKIISLHKDKRNLATDLLDGQNMSGKLSDDDLINLIVS